MTLSLAMITIDTADAEKLAGWWSEQLGGVITETNGGWYVIVKVESPPVLVSFQKVEDPTPGKNKVHLDLMTEDLDAEVERLLVRGREPGGAARGRELPLGHARRPGRQPVLRRRQAAGRRRSSTQPADPVRAAIAAPKTSVCRSTSSFVCCGLKSAMLWKGVSRMPRLRAQRCRKASRARRPPRRPRRRRAGVGRTSTPRGSPGAGRATEARGRRSRSRRPR